MHNGMFVSLHKVNLKLEHSPLPPSPLQYDTWTSGSTEAYGGRYEPVFGCSRGEWVSEAVAEALAGDERGEQRSHNEPKQGGGKACWTTERGGEQFTCCSSVASQRLFFIFFARAARSLPTPLRWAQTRRRKSSLTDSRNDLYCRFIRVVRRRGQIQLDRTSLHSVSYN